jgi:imidazolonepropionase-like amidohydrolase
VPATYAIGATGGHCDATEFPPSVQVPAPGIANGPQEIRAVIRKLRKYGAEVIKFCGTGGVFSKTDSVAGQQYSLAEMQALVDEAHMLGLRVAVHAHGVPGIQDAIRAGVDTIEHASLADAETIELAKAHGTYFSMDVYDDDYILAEGERNGTFKESLEKERKIGLLQRQSFKAAHAAGVKMIFGTDGGVYPNGDNAKQFVTMVQWGMTPMQAIQAATVTAAEALGRSADVGAIAVGRYGDLIAVERRPTCRCRVAAEDLFCDEGRLGREGCERAMTSRQRILSRAQAPVGRGMALEFAARGRDLALCARRLDRLIQLREEIAVQFPGFVLPCGPET